MSDEKEVTNSNVAYGAFSKVIDKSKVINNFGLNEKAVIALLEKMQQVLSEDISKSGEEVTDEVTKKLVEVIESKFIETVCKLTDSQQSSEMEIIRTVQQNFGNLQKNVATLANSIEAELNGLREIDGEYKSLAEGLNNLKEQYDYQANVSGEILKILEPIRDAVDRDKQTAKIELRMAEESLRNAQFEQAQELFRQVITRNYHIAEAYFGLALADCKIQPIFDYVQNCEQPICFDNSIDFLANQNYQTALKFCSNEQKVEFEKCAKDIAEILKYFREFREKEQNSEFNTAYDCFICVKVTGKDGRNTDDCKWLADNNVYEELNKEVRTFYSEIDCKNRAKKGSLKYGAFIMYALSRAKCLLLVCSEEEYLQTPWVKNEYTRFCNFLKLRNQDAAKQIVMVTKGKELELPNGLREKGYQDINRATQFNISDLVETVQSVVNVGKGYVERYWKYCPVCGEQYPNNKSICNSNKSCAGTKLVDTHIYLNELLRKAKEDIEKEREEFHKREAEFNEEIKAKIEKKADEAEKQVLKLQNALDKANEEIKKALDVQSALSKQKSVCEKKIRVFENAFASIKANERKRTESFNLTFTNLNNGLDEIDRAAEPKVPTVLWEPTIEEDSDLSPLTDFVVVDGLLIGYTGKGGDIAIPNSVTKIDSRAFDNCKSFTSISIPNSVTSIPLIVFWCSSLSYITVATDNSVYSDQDGVLFNKDKSEIICYPANRLEQFYVIPNSVMIIGFGAFKGCKNLKNVSMPKRLQTFIDSAFGEEKNHIHFDFIEDEAVTFDKSLDDYPTLENYDKTEFEIKGTELREYIGKNSIVKIPNGVTNICSLAFFYYNGLTSITIPDSVRSIDRTAFMECSSRLTSISVGVNNNTYKSVNNCLLTKDGQNLVLGCKTSIIPDGVRSIGDDAFSGCSGLTRITIPDGVVSIGNQAFDNCVRLTNITIPDSVSSIGEYVFNACSSLKHITFKGTVKKWKAIKKGNYNLESITVRCSYGRITKW